MAVTCKGYEVSYWIMLDTVRDATGTDLLVSPEDLEKLKIHLHNHLALHCELDPMCQVGDEDIYISEDDFDTEEDATAVFCIINKAALEVLENY